jgi:lipoate---protein ligase
MLLNRPHFKIIHLKDVSIFDQLKLEEFLLRDTDSNYCIINSGSSPAIVMGISGKIEELVNIEQANEQNIPIIKRFSGGGTVVIDENTLFVTIIGNSKELNVPCFPEPIYKFTESIYKDVFDTLPFELKQNDYILNERKCGGNAQYIKKDRWLHHTSFLWDYNPVFMSLLKHPKKTPEYRKNRAHEDFICTLKDFLPKKTFLSERLLSVLEMNFNTNNFIPDLDNLTPSRFSTLYMPSLRT